MGRRDPTIAERELTLVHGYEYLTHSSKPRFAGSEKAGDVWAFVNIFHPEWSLSKRLKVAQEVARADPQRI